jgi:hypothetical protein
MRKVLNYPAIDILVELLKHHVLILAALVYIYSLNIIMFSHLPQIYLDYFQRLGQLARAENISLTQEIIAISTVLYALEVFYFVLIYHSKKYIFSRFLFLFALWSALTLGFKYPLSLLRVFVFDVVNLIKIDRIEGQELTADIATGTFYTLISFYIFRILIEKTYFGLKWRPDIEDSNNTDIPSDKIRPNKINYFY